MGFAAVNPNGGYGAVDRQPPRVFQGGQPGARPPRGGVYDPNGGGGATNRQAIEGAKAAQAASGAPTWQDLVKLSGGGTHPGDAGVAGGAVDTTRDAYTSSKDELGKQQVNIEKARRGIEDPTSTRGFQSLMRLNNERGGMAEEAANEAANNAASRRGFVGGYNPERTSMDRQESLALAGGQAAQDERKSQQDLFTGESGLYNTEMGGRNAALDAYTKATQTAAELPTKWLDSYSRLLGGLSGGFGDIFGTASRNSQYDTNGRREDADRLRREHDRARAAGASGQY